MTLPTQATASGPPWGHVIGSACLVLLAAGTAWAAPPFGGRAGNRPQAGNGAPAGYQAAANEVTEFSGKLKGVRGNVMTLTREDGAEVMVQFPETAPQLTFVAKAVPAFLRRGMLVRFDATLGPTGVPLQPIEKLEIFAPIDTRGIPRHSLTNYAPGVHPADRQARPPNTPIAGPVTVVGNLMMITPQGGLAVQTGRAPMQTMLAPTAEFQLRYNNLSLAQEGDTVKVAGFYQPPDDTKVKGDRVTITTDRVYGETPEPTPRGARRGRSKGRAGRAAEQVEAAEQTEAAEQVEAAAESEPADN